MENQKRKNWRQEKWAFHHQRVPNYSRFFPIFSLLFRERSVRRPHTAHRPPPPPSLSPPGISQMLANETEDDEKKSPQNWTAKAEIEEPSISTKKRRKVGKRRGKRGFLPPGIKTLFFFPSKFSCIITRDFSIIPFLSFVLRCTVWDIILSFKKFFRTFLSFLRTWRKKKFWSPLLSLNARASSNVETCKGAGDWNKKKNHNIPKLWWWW